ncbi:MAG: DUF418 domain-containing protein [Bacteroidota bacterium]
MAAPTVARERYEVLDALRGFALFGILLANLNSFFGLYFLSSSEIVGLPLADRLVLFGIDWFVEGKFYTIFSLLFGMGCALQMPRFDAGPDAFRWYWIRRMLLLMAIGLTHMFFVWNGDILTLYSVLGLILLPLARLQTKTLWVVAVVLLLIPLANHAIVMATQDAAFWSSLSRLSDGWKESLGYGGLSLFEMRTSSDPREVLIINMLQAVKRPIGYLMTARYQQVLGIFVLGVIFARTLTPRIQGNEPIPTRWWLVPGLIGLVFSFAYAWTKWATGSYFGLDAFGLLQAVVYHICAPTLGVGLAGAFYTLWRSRGRSAIMSRLALLGRMALTNYILQTTLAMLLFFGYGLGLMGTLPYAAIPLVAVVIFLFQTRFSAFWLSRYPQGPLELAWKRLAYGATRDSEREAEASQPS